MTIFIALLRAVNLGAHGKLAMADLRQCLAGLGLPGQTLLQSGNVVFEGKDAAPAGLEPILEAETARRLGLATDFFVRSRAEWDGAVAANPFPEEAEGDPAHLLLLCLKAAPRSDCAARLRAAIAGRERVVVKGRSAYAHYPDGIGRSKLSLALIEARLGTRATARNWNTVLKIGELAAEMAGASEADQKSPTRRA